MLIANYINEGEGTRLYALLYAYIDGVYMLVSEVVDKTALVQFIESVIFLESKRDSLEVANLKRLEKNIPALNEGEESKIFSSYRLEESELNQLIAEFGSKIELVSMDKKHTFMFYLQPSKEVTKKDGSTFISDCQISWVESSKVTTNVQITLNPDSFRSLS